MRHGLGPKETQRRLESGAHNVPGAKVLRVQGKLAGWRMVRQGGGGSGVNSVLCLTGFCLTVYHAKRPVGWTGWGVVYLMGLVGFWPSRAVTAWHDVRGISLARFRGDINN
jgi:hypothetical protein